MRHKPKKNNRSTPLRPNALFKSAAALGLGLTLSGCGGAQSPTFLLFDSYFPSWLVGVFVAVPITLFIRSLLIRSGLDDELPLRLLVYVCIGLCFTMAFAYFFSPR